MPFQVRQDHRNFLQQSRGLKIFGSALARPFLVSVIFPSEEDVFECFRQLILSKEDLEYRQETAWKWTGNGLNHVEIAWNFWLSPVLPIGWS